MAFLFNRGRRQPLEVVRSIKDLLEKLRETPNTPKVCPCANPGMLKAGSLEEIANFC